MGKRVIIVPPQAVSVNVSVSVGTQPVQQGQVPAQPPPHQQLDLQQPQPTQVNTAVHVAAGGWPGPVGNVEQGPYVPSFQMPTSDVLRRNIPKLARAGQGPGLGDHVHDAKCAEDGCDLLAASLPAPVQVRPWAILGWVLVALCVWSVQYSLIVPLVWLGAVAHSAGAKTAGWFAILLCGFGPFFSLFYLCSPAVPKHALTPWGLAQIQR